MTAPSVLLIASFDDAEHAHSFQRVRALERLGCDVTTFDLRRRPGLLGFLGGSDLRSRLLKSIEVAEANLVLVTGGYDIDEGLVEVLRSSTGVKLANWFTDDMRRIDEILPIARAYDTVFVVGSDVASACDRSFGKTIEVLPLGADPSVYRPVKSRDQYRANVVFAGGATPERERHLSELLEFGLALWGPGWRRTSLRDYCRGEIRSTAEFVRAYGGASVAVNLHHGFGDKSGVGASCNQRLFELSAMGVPQVVDERADLPRYFDVGREVVTFTSARDLKERVQELLQAPAVAEELGAAARRKVLACHTQMHRMRRILEAVGLVPNAPPASLEPAGD